MGTHERQSLDRRPRSPSKHCMPNKAEMTLNALQHMLNPEFGCFFPTTWKSRTMNDATSHDPLLFVVDTGNQDDKNDGYDVWV
jgi:hypothetical protein